jgi:hypothetical protein
MVQEDLFALFSALASERGVFLYSGTFPDEHTPRLIDISQQTLATQEGGDRSAMRRTTFALIEAYQNIVRHRMARSVNRDMLVLAHGKTATSIITANSVADVELPGLRSALGRLEGLDTDALKQLFISILQAGNTTARGGAGLGFIEMSRRTGNPLSHRIVPATSGLHRFHLLVNCTSMDPARNMAWVADLDRLSTATGVLLAIGGTEWSTTADKQVLLLLDDGPQVDTAALARAALAGLHVVHGLRENGAPALLLCRNAGGTPLVNVLVNIEKARVADVLGVVTSLNSASPKQRKEMCQEALLHTGGPVEAWRAGLCDLAQHASVLGAEERELNDRSVLLIEARI